MVIILGEELQLKISTIKLVNILKRNINKRFELSGDRNDALRKSTRRKQ